MSNAAAETIRMSRLANLLDSEVNSNAIENALAELAEMQSDNGGWSWCPGMDDSMFYNRSDHVAYGNVEIHGVSARE